MNKDELYSCEALECRLSYEQCSLRHVKGRALTKGETGGWVPEQWARYSTPCRSCAIGKKHAAILGTKCPSKPGPNKPPSPLHIARSKKQVENRPYSKCQRCKNLHRSKHHLCAQCRRKGRKQSRL